MGNSGLVQFHTALDPLMTDINDVCPAPYNPRNGDVDAIMESITVNGFIAPVVAQRSTGHILAGNHRYYALMELGADQIPVVWLDVDDQAARRYCLADNRTSDLGNYDTAILVELLEALQAEDSLLGTGYREFDLEVLRALNEIEADDLDVASWPTLTFTVPPHVKHAFIRMTAHGGDDREKFEILLRLAGWDGKRPR